MQLAFEEQKNLLSAPTSSFQYPRCPPHLWIDPKHDQGRASNATLGDLGSSPALGNQGEGEETQKLPQLELAAEEKNGRGDDSEPEPEERGEKQCLSETSEEDNSYQYSENDNSPREANDKGIGDDEHTRLAKWRKYIPRMSRNLSTSAKLTPVAEAREVVVGYCS